MRIVQVGEESRQRVESDVHVLVAREPVEVREMAQVQRKMAFARLVVDQCLLVGDRRRLPAQATLGGAEQVVEVGPDRVLPRARHLELVLLLDHRFEFGPRVEEDIVASPMGLSENQDPALVDPVDDSITGNLIHRAGNLDHGGEPVGNGHDIKRVLTRLDHPRPPGNRWHAHAAFERFTLAAGQKRIYFIRGIKVMLDRDLAELYGVETSQLKRAVRRNIDRFPKDFMFELTKKELEDWRCQFGTSRWGGTRYSPFAFTEQGVAMLSSVINSERAIQVNIQIMRTFTQLRNMIATHEDLKHKIEAMKEKYDEQFRIVFEAITQLLEVDQKPKKKIGYLKERQVKWTIWGRWCLSRLTKLCNIYFKRKMDQIH